MKSDTGIPDNLGEWLKGQPSDDIVISSRIRLARNLSEFNFPNRSSGPELEEVKNIVFSALNDWQKQDGGKNLFHFDMEKLDELEREVLIERHLISRAQAENPAGSSTHIDKAQSLSLMVNEEDHLRMQFIKTGDGLEKAWEEADDFDDFLEEKLDYAFSSRLGYLTACPTNLGTGLRASVMLHLPGLNMTDEIGSLLGGVGKFGFTVRGIFGEGTDSEGSIYQLSNQVTLGYREEDIIDNLYGILHRIREKEIKARKMLEEERSGDIKNKIMRAFGILRHSYKVNYLESIHFTSLLLLGDYYQLFSEFDRDKLMELMILTRPAHLQLYSGDRNSTDSGEVRRAELIKESLSSFKI